MKLISSTLGYFRDSPYLKMEKRRWFYRNRNKAMGFVKDKGVVAHDVNVKTALFFGNKVADKTAGHRPQRQTASAAQLHGMLAETATKL